MLRLSFSSFFWAVFRNLYISVNYMYKWCYRNSYHYEMNGTTRDKLIHVTRAHREINQTFLKAHSHESGSYPDSRNVDQILLPANPDLIRIPFTCANEETVPMHPFYCGQHPSPQNKQGKNPGYYHSSWYCLWLFYTSQSSSWSWSCTARLFTAHIRQTTSDCFVDRAVFVGRFQLKLNGLITPYVKEILSFTLHPTSSSHHTKLPEISFHVNAKGYYLLTRKDNTHCQPRSIHLIQIESTSRDGLPGFGSDLNHPATGLHVNGIVSDLIWIQVPVWTPL